MKVNNVYGGSGSAKDDSVRNSGIENRNRIIFNEANDLRLYYRGLDRRSYVWGDCSL